MKPPHFMFYFITNIIHLLGDPNVTRFKAIMVTSLAMPNMSVTELVEVEPTTNLVVHVHYRGSHRLNSSCDLENCIMWTVRDDGDAVYINVNISNHFNNQSVLTVKVYKTTSKVLCVVDFENEGDVKGSDKIGPILIFSLVLFDLVLIGAIIWLNCFLPGIKPNIQKRRHAKGSVRFSEKITSKGMIGHSFYVNCSAPETETSNKLEFNYINFSPVHSKKETCTQTRAKSHDMDAEDPEHCADNVTIMSSYV